MKSVLLAVLVAAASPGGSGQVRGSPHDLTRASNTSAARAAPGAEVGPCAYCHASHGAGQGLSARPEPGGQHLAYGSGSMAARPGAPTGVTRSCLSCHDGTIAVGQTRAGLPGGAAAAGAPLPAAMPANLGTDLRGGHPVSFRPVQAAGTHPPAPGDPVRLDGAGQLQCTACHDPHRQFGGDPSGRFLVKSTRRSLLCLTCHEGSAVAAAGSAHASSGKPFGPAEGNGAGAASVADAGCAACHAAHGGAPGGRLVRRQPGEDDDAPCLRCHATAVVNVPMGPEASRPYGHARLGAGVHDAAEGRPGSSRPLPESSAAARRHATCVDCHDPHAASARSSGSGLAAGPLAGVWGISQTGQRVEQVRFEYEVCWKCHGDSANKPSRGGPQAPRRAVADANLRRVFDPSAISAHPVVAPGRGADVPSLKPPLTVSSLITCSDCHASDRSPAAGGAGPRGPHGSAYPGLLERPYLTADFTVEGPTAYALCYKCHDREKLLRGADSPFRSVGGKPLHELHVVQRATPCSACHASHGVSSLAGARGENEHLVDFDLNIVRPGPDGRATYKATGPRHGSCSVSCHGNTTPHAPAVY